MLICVAASAFDRGQFCLASSAYFWKAASSTSGISASVSSSICVIVNASPTFSSLTLASVWIRFAVMPARESAAVIAIVKQPACAAPSNSSGLVAASPSSNRDLNEYGPSKAPLPTFNLPLPWARFPSHSASAFRVGILSFHLSVGLRIFIVQDLYRSCKLIDTTLQTSHTASTQLPFCLT